MDLHTYQSLTPEEAKKVKLSPAEMVSMLNEQMLDGFEMLAKRIKTLELNMREVQEGGIRYCGTFQRAITYNKGHMVTYAGSLWASLHDNNTDSPGNGKTWQLAVKAGKDAR